MKKILFSLVALVCSMSMNAQVMKVMKNGEVEAAYKGSEYSVVFEEEQGSTTTGTAKRTGDIEVTWVQLWKNGPKFAEYNVGAANNKAEDDGGYYCWGSSIDKDSNAAYKEGPDALTGSDDTATNLWGSNWRMPTKEELQALLDNCNVTLTPYGLKFTGRRDYASNSLFLPAAGFFYGGRVNGLYAAGAYWSSTSYGSDNAYYLSFDNIRYPYMVISSRNGGCSVRAVLAE